MGGNEKQTGITGGVYAPSSNIDPGIFKIPRQAEYGVHESTIKRGYDEEELQAVINAMKRLGIFDLKESGRLPSAASMYSTEGIQF